MIKNIFISFWNTCTKIINFKSRANRKEYTYYLIVQIIFNICLYPIHTLYVLKIHLFILYFFLLVQMIFVLITLSLIIRRLHDIDVSGWWYLFYISISTMIYLYFVGKDDGFSLRTTIIGYSTFIFMEVFLIFFKGTEGPNKYGDPPEY